MKFKSVCIAVTDIIVQKSSTKIYFALKFFKTMELIYPLRKEFDYNKNLTVF